MATIDDKVVAMSFESSKFEQGVNRAITALDKLKKSLKFDDAGKGISAVSRALGHLQLGKVGAAVDSVSNKLRTFHLVAIGILANIGAQAVRAGARFIKALTLDPIIQGYREYETQLNSVQTILSNTRAAGVKLKDVNKALNELNHYADKTIYNFSEMTRNIGTFTAAGVDLKTSVASIKGIANLAAVSGSNAEQASTAMYQLSQAISSGTVKLQDWNSVVNAGMGGTLFQRALAQTAQHMGTLKEGAVTLSGKMKNVTIDGQSFRQSLASAGPGKQSWLTSKVLTTTLKQLSGDMTDAQLAAEGYSKAQIKAIQDQAKMAVQAATQVKTLSQLIDTTKEAVGSGWAQTWMIIFGDFGEAKTLFTGLSNAINGFVGASADARNKVLKDWKALGGRTLLLSALKQAFHDLVDVIRPIKEAFRDIFPKATGKDLYNLTVRFKQLTDRLKPSQQTIDNLRRTFRGLFALLDIGKQIIGGIFSVFAKLIGATGAGDGAFLNLTGNIGDFLVSVDNALKKGNALANFFDGLGDILAGPIKFLGDLREELANLFSGFSPGGFSDQVNGMTGSLTPLQRVLEAVANAWDKFASGFSQSGAIFQPALDALVKFISGLGPALNTAIQNMNFEAILQVIRTGLLGGIFLLFKNFFGKGSLLDQVSKGFAGGILANISGSFKALEGSMTALQTNIKAKTLKEIAIAIALLTASVVALSFVDPKKLNSALAGITIMLGQLLGAMALMDKITSSGAFYKLPLVAASLIALAAAIDILVIAVYAMSRLSWEELIKGLGGVAVLLIGLTAAAIPLAAGSSGMVRAGAGITAMAIGINILALAVRSMGSIPLGNIAKGLIGIAAGLIIIAGAMKLMPPGMVLQGAGLIAVAVGLRIMANVIAAFGALKWSVIGKGLVGVAGALVAIGLAMKLMPPNMVLTAAGLLLVSIALKGITKAIATLGGMTVTQLAKGLISLALSLTILAAAMIAMQGAIGGAVALTIAAAGLALLAPALVILGKQSWGQILKGLITLAAALAVLGIAAIALQPAIPAMIGLGAALVLIGGGLALAGVGIALIGVGLSAIAVAAPTAVGVILQAFVDLQKGVIQNAKLLVLGLLEVVRALAATAPKFVDALVKILSTLLDAIVQLAPKLKEVMNTLIVLLLDVLDQNQGKIIQAGFNLLLALLKGIRDNIGQVVKMVADIIIALLNALQRQLNRIQRAGLQVIVNFVKGIVSNYTQLVKAGLNMVVNLVKGIASSISKIAAAALNIVTTIVRTIANSYLKLYQIGANVVASFIRGLGSASAKIIAAGVSAISQFIRALVNGALKLVNVGAQAVIKFLNGVATAIDKYEPQLIAAGARIGAAIVTGMVRGLGQAAPSLFKAAGDLVNKAKRKLEFWKSPPDAYGEWLGQSVISGFAKGLSDSTEAVSVAAEVSQSVIDTFNNIFQTASPSRVMQQIGQFVGQGFAKGLRGSREDIKGVFQELNNDLSKAIADAKQTIAQDRAKIAEEQKKKPKDRDKGEIRAANAEIREQEVLLRRLNATRAESTKGLAKERAQLLANKSQWAKLTEQLDKAKDALEEAKRTRDDAISGFKEQYGELPDVIQEVTDEAGNTKALTGAEQLAAYEAALKHQTDAVAAYQSTLQQLRKLGLDDATYQKLLREGPADQQFADALLKGGKTAVQSLNKLDSGLMTQATKLATNAGNNLYQAGVNAAQGLVNGLQSKVSALEKAMEKIAVAMIKALKKKLKIKSPSEVFAELGNESMAGMAVGISDSTKLVTDAVDQAAQDALVQMQESMAGISSAVFDSLDQNPVITPILDLTQVRSQAGELANVVPITAAVSFGQASAISTAQTSAEEAAAAAGGPTVKFEQNNYSPEALSNIEIYRQTKNQLSQFKSALALT